MTIGETVFVTESTLPDSGRGLFALKDFKSNEIITEYCGEEVTFNEARSIADRRYIMQCEGKFIDGMREPVRCLGGGSFSNSKRNNWNAVKCLIDNKIYLKVRRGHYIKRGSEIFINYGSHFHKQLALQHESQMNSKSCCGN